jgi:AAA+ ATPase superfamily predicted ATPase
MFVIDIHGDSMTEFIGRRNELRCLEKAYTDAASAFLPIYGRRRVGKSELILHFIKNKPSLYFAGSRAPTAVQLSEFMMSASIVLEKPHLAFLQARDWKAAFRSVLADWKGPRKLILVLDEFQWMVEGSKELPSDLQQLWDREWRDSGKVFLILCGSYIGFMEREVLGSKSPLFGRRTGQMLIRPFTLKEAGLFHPGYSLEDRARTYFITGGIPLYLKLFKQTRSVESNIQDCFLDEYAPLYREVEFLMREELRDVMYFYGILTALAGQCNTVKSLAHMLEMDSRSLPYYLQQLVSLGYIQKHYPQTGKKPSAKHVRYTISDPLLRFWFKFIYPHASSILQLGGGKAFAAIIKPELPSFFGHCFEALCRQALPAIYAREGIVTEFEIGEYWDAHVQIDVVGYRMDGWTDLCECKWGRITSLHALREELERKVRLFPNSRNATIGRRIFTRQPPTIDCQGLTIHTLENIYAAYA